MNSLMEQFACKVIIHVVLPGLDYPSHTYFRCVYYSSLVNIFIYMTKLLNMHLMCDEYFLQCLNVFSEKGYILYFIEYYVQTLTSVLM